MSKLLLCPASPSTTGLFHVDSDQTMLFPIRSGPVCTMPSLSEQIHIKDGLFRFRSFLTSPRLRFATPIRSGSSRLIVRPFHSIASQIYSLAVPFYSLASPCFSNLLPGKSVTIYSLASPRYLVDSPANHCCSDLAVPYLCFSFPIQCIPFQPNSMQVRFSFRRDYLSRRSI